MANGGQRVALADAGVASGDKVDCVVEERSAAQALELLADERRKTVELQGMEGLVGWQAREPQQARNAVLFTLDALRTHQLVQERLMGQAGFGGLERHVLELRGDGR